MGVFGTFSGAPKKTGLFGRIIGSVFGRDRSPPVLRKRGSSGDSRDSEPSSPQSIGTTQQRVPDQRAPEQRAPGLTVPQRRGVNLPTPWSYNPNSPSARFLSGEWISVVSTNVDRIYYDLDKSTLRVIFLDQNEYHYWPISPEEAVSILQARSKGGWVWDNLRIRGTALGHKKFYIHVGISAASGKEGDVRQRKWIETPASMVEHLQQVGAESQPRGYDVVGTIPESVPTSFWEELPRFLS